METLKERSINAIVDTAITAFAEGLTSRYEREVDDPEGVINAKKNNCFMAELGEEFMFYSAFVRSFDSSFGNILETMGNKIATLSYEVRNRIDSFILPDQTNRISSILDSYKMHIKPEVSHYKDFTCIVPQVIDSYKRSHETDNYFYKASTNTHLVKIRRSNRIFFFYKMYHTLYHTYIP